MERRQLTGGEIYIYLKIKHIPRYRYTFTTWDLLFIKFIIF